MPSEHELCARFSVSRTTVRHALADLAHMGLIYKRHGSGTYAHRVQPSPIKPLGLLIREPQKLSNPYFVDLIRGANTYLMSLGSHIAVINQAPGEWPAHLVASLAGVIVIPTPLEQGDIDVLKTRKIPFVICTDALLDGPIVSYGVETAARNLTECLLALGHRQFGLISGHRQHADQMKKTGVRSALEAAGIDFSTVPDFLTNFDENKGRRAAEVLLKKHPEVTAIIATDDLLALIAIQVARHQGRRVPGDLSVVGFNDLAVSALFEPSLTTVKFPVVEAGRRAAELICLNVLKSEVICSSELGHHIVWRQSAASVVSFGTLPGDVGAREVQRD